MMIKQCIKHFMSQRVDARTGVGSKCWLNNTLHVSACSGLYWCMVCLQP